MVEIAVTGMGVWSAAGTSPESLWASALGGVSPACWWEGAGHRFAVCRAEDPPSGVLGPRVQRMDRGTHLALAAAGAAFRSARLDPVDPERVALFVGNSRGPVGTWHEPASPRVRPSRVADTAIASISGALSLALGIRGPCLTVSATCASAAHAIAMAGLLIQSGAAEVALAGGAEAPLVPALLEQFHASRMLGSHGNPALACRPFASDRNGMVPGEGAGFLVLESTMSARARGQPVLATLGGSALAAEAHHRLAVRADGEGLARVITQALRRAGVAPGDIGHVNAHGTGTRMNDQAEAVALRRALGEGGGASAVCSTKPVTGHTFGAAAALEAILAIQALRHQMAPPTAGSDETDPALGIDVVRGGPRPIRTRHVLSSSLGIWGNAAALVFGEGGG